MFLFDGSIFNIRVKLGLNGMDHILDHHDFPLIQFSKNDTPELLDILGRPDFHFTHQFGNVAHFFEKLDDPFLLLLDDFV